MREVQCIWDTLLGSLQLHRELEPYLLAALREEVWGVITLLYR